MITIIMPTYKRNDFLSDKNHPTLNVLKNSLVDKLIIVWQNIGEKVPNSIIENLKNLNIFEKVHFEYPEKNSLNNRFFPYKTKNCVLSIDDDYLITDEALEKCYKIWLENQNSIVGIVPRFMDETEYSGKAADKGLVYKYNVILTGGAMFNSEMLKIYYSDKENLKIMDEIFNGEDIMFNFIHNHHFKTKPIYVHDDRVKTWKRVKGNSIADRSNGNHMIKRHKVYKIMEEKYGDVLITTKEKYFI